MYLIIYFITIFITNQKTYNFVNNNLKNKFINLKNIESFLLYNSSKKLNINLI